MRTLIWVVAIIALAVAVTLAASLNDGYLLLVLPPYRIELSLNLLVVLAIGGFAAGYVLVRLIAVTLDLPRAVREYRRARRKERARAVLVKALQEYFAGRYGRAEKAAVSALDLDEQPGLAAVVAARAAHVLRAQDRRDAYLARAADAADPEADVARLVAEAEFLLDERRPVEALSRLKQLPRQHTAALRLELKAQQQARNWEQVVALADTLRRRDVFDATQAEQVRRAALVENLKRKALDAAALEAAWAKTPSTDRTDRRVATAVAQCFIALGGCDQAHRIIEGALEADWDSNLVSLYAECEGGDVVKRIERAEAWLKRQANDAVLLLTLGRLCAAQGLWGKAQSYLDASLAIEPTHSAHLASARLQERLGNVEAAARHYRESLTLALAQLKTVTGGRRRAPL